MSESMMDRPAKPVPDVTPELAPFFAAAKRRELRVQRCRGCNELRFPPRGRCASCWSKESDWVKVSGRGEVWSFNVMHQVYHPAFAGEVPYAVVLVKLAEGPKMLSNLLGVPPTDIRIGMPVRVTFEDVSDAVTLVKFEFAPVRG